MVYLKDFILLGILSSYAGEYECYGSSYNRFPIDMHNS